MPTNISKALRFLSGQTTKASAGTLTSFIQNTSPAYGQPASMEGDMMGLITPERMREIVIKTPTASASMLAIVDYCVNVELDLRNRDPSKDVPTRQYTFLKDILRAPNTQDDQREFKEKLYRDLATLGFAAIEIERNAGGGVANLWPLDAARIRIDYDEHGTVLGYDMLNSQGVPIRGADGVHGWQPKDIIFISRGAQTSSRYPASRIVPLFAAAVIESLIMSYIGAMFTEGNVPFGVMDLGDLSDLEIREAVAIWNNQAQQSGRHRIMLTGSKGGIKFVPFNGQLKDLDARNLLLQVRSQIMSIMGVTVNELGEAADVNKSNGFNLSYTFKKRAVEPILGAFCDKISQRLIWQELGYTDTEMYADEIDSRDELLQAQIDKIYLDAGIWTINKVRNRKGDVSIQGGDMPIIMLGANAVPVDMIDSFAIAQLNALESEVALMNETIQQAKVQTQMAIEAAANGVQGGSPLSNSPIKPTVSAPLIRGMQEPEKYSTVDAPGSTTAKLKFPRATPKLPTGTPQAARGPVQANRNAGARPVNENH